jgi:8-oxo-dGTP pyrophosphatase MutT (NUDIX family)
VSDLFAVDGPNPWQTRARRVVFENGFMRLREDTFIQPDGAPGSYAYVEVPWPVVAIVPVSDAGEVYLVRQWRYPWGRNSWEIPAGHGEVDENPLEGAQRELAEEVGVRAATWEPLGTGYASASVNARYHLFLARELSPIARPPGRGGSELDMIARPIPLVEAVAAAMDGRIQHGISVVGLLRAARRLGV